MTLIAGDALHIVLANATREANRLSLSTSLAMLVELGERFGLMEVLPDAADIALDFRILVGFDDERAEEMADQLIAQSATLLEQAEV